MKAIYLVQNLSSIMPSTAMFDYDRPTSIALYMMKKIGFSTKRFEVCDMHKVGLYISIYGNIIKILESVSLIKG